MYKITLDKDDFLRYQLFTASKSKRIKNKRIRTWILLTISFLVLGFALRQNTDRFLSYYFIGFSLITLIFYPLYQRRQYKKHYEKHINENYANRIGVESELGFENGFIVSVGDNQEGKIKLTEIQEINEISENLFVKIKTQILIFDMYLTTSRAFKNRTILGLTNGIIHPYLFLSALLRYRHKLYKISILMATYF